VVIVELIFWGPVSMEDEQLIENEIDNNAVSSLSHSNDEMLREIMYIYPQDNFVKVG